MLFSHLCLAVLVYRRRITRLIPLELNSERSQLTETDLVPWNLSATFSVFVRFVSIEHASHHQLINGAE
jgi:hypothetical protein